MDIERVELLVTLKGAKTWKKGTIFDPKKDGRPIPSDIIAEVRANSGAVRVLGAVNEGQSVVKSDASIKAEISEAETKLAELRAKIAEAEVELAETVTAIARPDKTESPEVLETDEKKKYVCKECGASFDYAVALAGHMKSHRKAEK